MHQHWLFVIQIRTWVERPLILRTFPLSEYSQNFVTIDMIPLRGADITVTSLYTCLTSLLIRVWAQNAQRLWRQATFCISRFGRLPRGLVEYTWGHTSDSLTARVKMQCANRSFWPLVSEIYYFRTGYIHL